MKITCLAIFVAALFFSYPRSVEAGIADGVRAVESGDYVTAVDTLLPYAENGVARAQFIIAQMYASGTGVEENLETARLWYGKAAEQGHVKAATRLGKFYLDLDNYEEAYKWYLMAAEAAHSPSQFIVGSLLLNSDMSFHNVDKGARWITRSAGRGYAESQYRLGMLLSSGPRKNPEKAIKWLDRASFQDHVEAKYRLATVYFQGVDVPRDRLLGLRYFFSAVWVSLLQEDSLWARSGLY